MESPEAFRGAYGSHLARMADAIFAGCPQIEELLAGEDWEDTVLRPLLWFASDEINRRFSPDQLEELHTAIEAVIDKVGESLEEIPGDGRSPLGDVLEVDGNTVAREPWRLRQG